MAGDDSLAKAPRKSKDSCDGHSMAMRCHHSKGIPMKNRFLCLGVVLLVFALWNLAGAEEPTAKLSKPSAAELIDGVVKEESKVDEVRSLYLRFEGVTTRTPEAVARAAERRKQSPDKKGDDTDKTNSWLKRTEEIELAFDKKRVRSFSRVQDSHLEVSVFDGVQAIKYVKFLTHEQEQYERSLSSTVFFEFFWLKVSWPRIAPHSFWFVKDRFSPADRARITGNAKDYTIVGEDTFRGRQCYVLENRLAWRRIHVGIDDRRLHGLTRYSLPRHTKLLPAVQRAAGRPFADDAEANAWLATLSDEQREDYTIRLTAEKFALMRPQSQFFLDNYREIAPGFWFPAVQGVDLFEEELSPPQVSAHREFQLVDAKVDTGLSDDLFTIQLRDGVKVYDGRYDPSLEYKQKADRTAAEWQAIVDARKADDDSWKKDNAARDELVGQPAPEFPKSTWLNSAPVTVGSLKGKVLILDFWATWCGPCRNDLPIAERLHQEAKDSGIVIIGVHAAGTEEAEIKKLAQKLELHYPIVIDLDPPAKFAAPGELASRLRVHGIPQAFLIDPQGRIAAHGQLAEIVIKARELATQEKK
jgi:thiol-disulfide isomerase/thioredoxin